MEGFLAGFAGRVARVASMNRRQLVRLLGAVPLLPLASATGSSAAAAAAPTTLRIGESDTGDIEPHQGSTLADSILMYNIYDTLVFPSLDGKTTEMRPHLAESIDIDPTGTVYTVKLRPNIKFHSGNVMTADDVVFSTNRMLALNKGYSSLFTGWIKSAEAKDPLTVVITLTNPYGTFYSSLARLAIVDAKTVMANKQAGLHGEFGDYGVAWTLVNSAGTGAYKVVFHSRAERTELQKFGDYFLGHNPKAPDVVRFTYAQTDLVVQTLFAQGQMDLVRPLIQAETKAALLKIKGVTLAPETGVLQLLLMLNNTKPPLDDPHFRKALAYAADYESMRELEAVTPEQQGAKPANGPLLETLPGFDPTLPYFAKQDMAKAKAEMALSKYNPGEHRIQIVWMATNRKTERFALMLQQNWQELGCQCDIESRIWAQFTTQLAKPETTPMVSPVYIAPPVPDPDSFLYQTYHSSRHGQWTAAEYFTDPGVDAMLDKGRTMPIGPERNELYKQISRKIVDQQPVIFAYQAINLYAKRDSFFWPNLETPGMNTGLQGGNHLFRIMEMKAAA
jgi:peptide/nickel transport system substrate-binding protein